MKNKTFFLILSWLVCGTISFGQEQYSKYQFFTSIGEIDFATCVSPNFLVNFGAGFKYNISPKFGVFASGGFRKGSFRISYCESSRHGDFQETNFNIGVNHEKKFTKWFSGVFQLSVFKTKNKVFDGLQNSRPGLPYTNWTYELDWYGLEFELGPRVHLNNSISIFILTSFKIGTGDFWDSGSFDLSNANFHGELIDMNQMGFAYEF